MIEISLWIIVGLFLGWNLPQPWYAKYVQSRVVELWKSFRNN